MHRGGSVCHDRSAMNNTRVNRNWRASARKRRRVLLQIAFINTPFSWMDGASVVGVTAVIKNLHCPNIEGEDNRLRDIGI